eukprot:3576442-Prorocentrum_lima.AAC.1
MPLVMGPQNTDDADIPVVIRLVSVLSTEYEVASGRRFASRAARQAATLKKRQYGSDSASCIIEGW